MVQALESTQKHLTTWQRNDEWILNTHGQVGMFIDGAPRIKKKKKY